MEKQNNVFWESDLVNNFQSLYKRYDNINDKIIFLINLYSDYRENHSFGEYDYMIFIDEKTEIERTELAEFINIELNSLKDELNKVDSNNISNKIKSISTKKTSYFWQTKPETELPELYILMIDTYKLIASETTYEQFNAVFTRQPIDDSFEPIKWHQDNASELLYFIYRLEQLENIAHNPKRADYQRLTSCFVKPNGMQFKVHWKQIKQSISTNLAPDKQKAIDELVNNF